MNQRQLNAYKNPCYIPEDANNPILKESEIFENLRITSILKILCLFDNDVWNAVLFVTDQTGNRLNEKDLPPHQILRLKNKINDLLDGVGKDETVFGGDESDFEGLRLLNRLERKRLPKPNLNKIFDIKERQKFALQNPFPTMVDMLSKRYTKEVRFGGMIFSTILTVGETPEGIKWHASCQIKDEDKKPVKLFETPAGHGLMRMEIVCKMLQDVGTGQKVTRMWDKDSDIFDVYKPLSPREIKQLPKKEFTKQDMSFIFKQAIRN